jgi:hypothetical protein
MFKSSFPIFKGYFYPNYCLQAIEFLLGQSKVLVQYQNFKLSIKVMNFIKTLNIFAKFVIHGIKTPNFNKTKVKMQK